MGFVVFEFMVCGCDSRNAGGAAIRPPPGLTHGFTGRSGGPAQRAKANHKSFISVYTHSQRLFFHTERLKPERVEIASELRFPDPQYNRGGLVGNGRTH